MKENFIASKPVLPEVKLGGLFERFKDSPIFNKNNWLDKYRREVKKKKRLARIKMRIKSRSKRKRLYENIIVYRRKK